MIKRLLVPTDGSEPASIGARYAVALASKLGASVLGLHVVDVKLLEGPFLRDLSASLGTAPYVNYQGNIAMLLDERGKAALNDLAKRCEMAQVPCDSMQVTGIVPRAIVENADLADLVVMGRGGEHDQWLEGLVGSTTEAVVRRARRPVLITATAEVGTDRFLVAYDGSRHARQALHTAAAFAVESAVPLELLVVGDEKREPTVEEARKYLQSHGNLEVTYHRRAGEPGEVIVQCAGEFGANLLVMGAYGHSKVRELVVGSTTAYAMYHAPCPVLLTR